MHRPTMSYQQGCRPRQFNNISTQLSQPYDLGGYQFSNGGNRMRPPGNSGRLFLPHCQQKMHNGHGGSPRPTYAAPHRFSQSPKMRGDFNPHTDHPRFARDAPTIVGRRDNSGYGSPTNRGHFDEFPPSYNRVYQNQNNSKQDDRMRPVHTGNKNHGKTKKPFSEEQSKCKSQENPQYYCDTCDRGFKTEEMYTQHKEQHEKCLVPGCSYVAAPKLVQLHRKMQHSTGLAKKIWSMESEEDVKKWREERKKNYPTAANVAKKKTEESEKIARGELIETKYFGKMKHNNSGKGRFDKDKEMSSSNNNDGNSKWKHNRRRKRKNKSKNFNLHQDESSSPKKLKNDNRFDTESETQQNACNLSISDPNTIVDPNNNCENRLKFDGPSSVDHKFNTEGVNSEVHEEAVEFLSKLKENISCSAKMDNGDLGSITNGVERKSHFFAKDNLTDMKVKEQPNNSRKIPKKADLFHPKHSSLLEKLLAAEIRRERNIILQCVHYIAKRNFFQKRSEKNIISDDTCDSVDTIAKDSSLSSEKCQSSQSHCQSSAGEICEHTRTVEENTT